jgi:UDP-GlcNAc:undecaprenyl-phosphate GlcNAc-1-phosphate transferase
MFYAAIVLLAAAFLTSFVGTFLARRTARRLGLMDDPGHRKVHTIPTPRNGGIGIFWGFALPLLAGIIAIPVFEKHITMHLSISWVFTGQTEWTYVFRLWNMNLFTVPDLIVTHLPGMRAHIPLLLTFLAATLLIHILGLIDDRKAMPPWPKLIAQLAIAGGLVVAGEFVDPLRGGAFRILTFLGNFPAPGFFISALVSILWIVALTNAFNFLDNMDGLSAGVAFICALAFLIAAIFNGQLFIAALLLTFMGSVLGFLCFNFPPASIFMGDGGSMILGFILSVLTIRTTYYDASKPPDQQHWYAVLMPLFVMAVPLYDLTIVSVLRLKKGRSPMTGDTNHFSHRLTRHGFSKRGAVLLIYAVTLATGFAAPLLARINDDASALLLAGQLLAILIVIAILERVGEHTQ